MNIDFIKVSYNHLIDPTITRMTALQKYLQNLCNRREVSKVEFDQMRPRNRIQQGPMIFQRYIKLYHHPKV